MDSNNMEYCYNKNGRELVRVRGSALKGAVILRESRNMRTGGYTVNHTPHPLQEENNALLFQNAFYSCKKNSGQSGKEPRNALQSPMSL